MTHSQQPLELPDGRALGYTETGDPHGHPVVYCHGTPSTGVEWRLWDADELTRQLGLRVIIPDRPARRLRLPAGSAHE